MSNIKFTAVASWEARNRAFQARDAATQDAARAKAEKQIEDARNYEMKMHDGAHWEISEKLRALGLDPEKLRDYLSNMPR